MKVLFLDIDGVLHSTRSREAFGGRPNGVGADQLKLFDACAVFLIRRCCKETGARVVLSSSWRVVHKWSAIGEALGLPIIGATPTDETLDVRGEEIAAWMRVNGTPTRYAIVDDDDSELLPEQRPFVVCAPSDDGLQWRNYERLLELLKGEQG